MNIPVTSKIFQTLCVVPVLGRGLSLLANRRIEQVKGHSFNQDEARKKGLQALENRYKRIGIVRDVATIALLIAGLATGIFAAAAVAMGVSHATAAILAKIGTGLGITAGILSIIQAVRSLWPQQVRVHTTEVASESESKSGTPVPVVPVPEQTA